MGGWCHHHPGRHPFCCFQPMQRSTHTELAFSVQRGLATEGPGGQRVESHKVSDGGGTPFSFPLTTVPSHLAPPGHQPRWATPAEATHTFLRGSWAPGGSSRHHLA